jgi:hypothetical protein
MQRKSKRRARGRGAAATSVSAKAPQANTRTRTPQPKRQSLAIADGRLAAGTIVPVGATRWRAIDYQGRVVGIYGSLCQAVAALPQRGEP